LELLNNSANRKRRGTISRKISYNQQAKNF
jgi:hypothetical protein